MNPRLATAVVAGVIAWTAASAQTPPTPAPAPAPTPTPAPVEAPVPTDARPSDGTPRADEPVPTPEQAAATAPVPTPEQAAAATEEEAIEADFPTKSEMHRNFAGSVQLDYMAVPSRKTGREVGFDGATVEVSLKLAMDFSSHISSNVKVCVACHGFEVGMAFFDLRVADQLNFRVGRFSPAFGEFPLRHDPANHRTSDKPLPYDMGRMVRMTEWNQGVLPAPWVDNGIEVNGTNFFGDHLQVDYAAYLVGGPRAGANPMDFDFRASRSGENYYIDNNSRPAYGGQLVMTVMSGGTSLALGASMMRGTYDPEHRNRFAIYGAHAVFRVRDIFFRAEYLSRLTEMSLTDNPAERFKYGAGDDEMYDPNFVKDGAYAEVEIPVGKRLSFVLREDGMRRRGNVSMSSAMRADSAVLRHTAGVAFLLRSSMRLKLSYEDYDFSDFDDEKVVHIGIAGPF